VTADGRPLVLIEPYAHRAGGHHQHALAALAVARPGSLVIAPRGVPGDTRAALHEASTRVVRAAGPAAHMLLTAARAAALVSACGRRVFASRRWPRLLRRAPHQATLLARCLTEAACLRTARRLTGHGAAAVVVLSASEALHGAAAVLGGLPHLRFVHELVTTQDAAVRLLGRLARRGEKQVVALHPTNAVRAQLVRAFPHLPGVVRPFAVDDGARLTAPERAAARAAFGLTPEDKAVCLVGGWWPYKDTATIDAALGRLRHPLHLLVAGSPLDEALLARWRALPRVHLHTMPGPVAAQALRSVYAADAALVARHPGVGKESGLVVDAARYGVALVVSDHDPDLTARLRQHAWARLFPAGDPGALAVELDRLRAEPPPRPGPRAPRSLGVPTAAEQATFLTDTYTHLMTGER
jgi:hypothetical protein